MKKLHSTAGQRIFKGRHPLGHDHEITLSWGSGYPAVDPADYLPNDGSYRPHDCQEHRERTGDYGHTCDDHEQGLVEPPPPTAREIRELEILLAKDDLKLFQVTARLADEQRTLDSGRIWRITLLEDGRTTEREAEATPEEMLQVKLHVLEFQHWIDQAQRHMKAREIRIADMEQALHEKRGVDQEDLQSKLEAIT